jgi:hypothetical protein
MSITIIDSVVPKNGAITIKPYFDPNRSNMGLEKYGMTLFDGVFHEEQLACIEVNGIKRYLTGLNEFAPEIKLIKDPDAKEARIREIRTVVAQLEQDLAANMVDIKDPDFWNKVKICKPDNNELWDRITVRAGNEPVYLDPTIDPYDLIKVYAIEAGGFSMVAKSLEDARTRAVPPKFYLDKYVETVSTKTEGKKLRNKALSELQKLFDKNTNKLFYVAKVIDPNSAQYKKSTPNDVIYDNMDKYITGEGIEPNEKRAAQDFLDKVALDMETLKLRALIKDASFYKQVATKADGMIYHMDSATLMGRNPSECVEFLKNPLHEQTLVDLTKKIEKYWNQ